MADIISALGAGSGVNIKELATNLVTAAREPQQKQIDSRKTEAETKISAVASILSTVSAFNDAIENIGNTKLFHRTPVSSDSSKVAVEFIEGSAPSAFSGQIAVDQLATQSTLRFGPLTTLDRNLAGGVLKIVNDTGLTRNFGAVSTLDMKVTSKGLSANALGWNAAYAAEGATTQAFASLANYFANGGIVKLTTGADGRPTEIALSDGSSTPLTLKITDPANYPPIQDNGVPQQGTLTIGGVQTGADELSFVFSGSLASQTTGLNAAGKTTLVGSLLKQLSKHVSATEVANPDYESGANIKLATKAAPPVGTEIASIDLTQYKTLTSLRDKIDSMDGLDANVVQGTINGVNGYYLVVKGGTGAASRMMASISGFTPLELDTSAGAVVKGQDAIVSVDGISMTSATNKFDEIIPGVRFTAVAKTQPGEKVSVSSRTNTEALSQAASILIGGFNTLQQAIAAQIKYDADPAKKGSLSGSTAARGVLADLRRFTTQPIAGYGSNTYTLAQIGVRTNKDGSLTLDEKVFAKMIAEKPDVVEAVLASKQSVSDSRIKVASIASTVPAGQYTLLKKDATTWTINGLDAKVSNNRLSGPAGSAMEGVVLQVPNAVLAAPVGYAATLSYGVGLLDRFKTMLSKVENKDSPLSVVSTGAEGAITKLKEEQAKLDTRMKALENRYLSQFIAMENKTLSNKSTQDSLTNFMDSWRASLKS